MQWTVIWRVSRFFALLDGIIPPENVKGFIFCTASPRVRLLLCLGLIIWRLRLKGLRVYLLQHAL